MDLQKCRTGEQIEGLKDLIADLPFGITMAEIGCWRGESMILFMQSGKVGKYFAVDIWKAPICKEAEREFDEKMKGLNVIKLKMTMKEAERLLPQLDFVYIDGSHAYKNVKEDIVISYNKIKDGGIIAGHDYAPRYKETVVRAVNEIFGKPDKIYQDSSWMIKI